jgi:hypothetical protein
VGGGRPSTRAVPAGTAINEVADSLRQREDDLRLAELPVGSALRAYYTETDFHRQPGGVRRDGRGVISCHCRPPGGRHVRG